MPYFEIIWNEEPGGNVEHIADHDLIPEDVEEVIFNPVGRDVSRSSGLPIVFGFTPQWSLHFGCVRANRRRDNISGDRIRGGGIEMARERGRRVYRKATEEERARHAKIREQIADELPEIKKRARQRLALLKEEGTPLRQVLTALRAERERQGLSLSDINERTGIDRAALSRLENNEDANPTLATLERYADAVGKQMVVLLSEPTI